MDPSASIPINIPVDYGIDPKLTSNPSNMNLTESTENFK